MTRSTPIIAWRARMQPKRHVLARAGTWLSTFGGLLERPEAQLSPASELIPHTECAKTAREDALGLLQLAAEVEHALMVQYLYAAWAIAPCNPQSESAASTLKNIAIQEMFHLISVQNLLIALDGVSSIHLGRDAIRSASTFNPLPLVLEGLDHSALSKYIVAEMPAEIADPSLRERVQKLRLEAKADAGVELNHVGAIYTALQWIFQEGDEDMEPLKLGLKDGYTKGWHLKKTDFLDGDVIEQFAAQRKSWHATEPDKKLLVVKTQDDGLKLIREIAEQGEGVGLGDDSHFVHFVKVLDLLEQGLIHSLPVPPSPFASHPPPSDVNEKTEVTDPYTRLWCDWFDIRYTMLWHDIGHALSIPMSNAVRRKLTNMVFSQMGPGLSALAAAVSSLPMGTPDGKRAAPSFGMVFQLLPEQSKFKERALELASLEADVAGRVKASPGFPASNAAADAYDSIMGPGGLHELRNQLMEQTT